MEGRVEGILVNARSLAGISTTISFPELSLTIDLGLCTRAALRTSTVALTHGHADHISGLHQYLGVRDLFGMGPSRLLCPDGAVQGLRDLVTSFGSLQGRPFATQVEGTRPGVEVEIARGLFLVPFPVLHKVPSVGYVVVRRVAKLKPAFLGLPGAEIARLRAEPDADLFDLVDEPLVAVTGDTEAGWLDHLDPRVRAARVLFAETTFIGGGRDVEAAHAGRHTHLDELAPALERLENRAIVLYHFSQIYKAAEIEATVRARLPASVADRVHLLIPEEADKL